MKLSKEAFSLLEVLVALVIASLALGWFLYFLSEVRFNQLKARQTVQTADQAWCFFLEKQNSIQELEDSEKIILEEIEAKGAKSRFLKVKYHPAQGVKWQILLFAKSVESKTETPSKPFKIPPSTQKKSKKSFPLSSRGPEDRSNLAPPIVIARPRPPTVITRACPYCHREGVRQNARSDL